MVKTAKDLHEKIVLQRGIIINDCITLEKLIEYFISIYFTGKEDQHKFNELLELILSTNRMSFDSKKQVFCYLIKRHYPEFDKNNKTLSKDLTDIIEFRNVLAHYIFNIDQNAIDKMDTEVTFLKYKNIKTELSYTDKNIMDIRRKLANCVLVITELFNSMGYNA